MAYCKTKTRYVAQVSIERFLLTHKNVYLCTFTEPGDPLDGSPFVPRSKTDAEKALKPYLDYLRRRGIDHLVCWELQKRLAWHPHVLQNGRCDVVEMRPWMMERGWGVQMRFDWVRRHGVMYDKHGHPGDSKAVVNYLTKKLYFYLTKARTDEAVEPRKKFFGGTRTAKCGNNRFSWNPATDTAHAMIYYYGRNLFWDMFQTPVTFRDLPIVMRLGLEDTNWLDVDFLYDRPFS